MASVRPFAFLTAHGPVAAHVHRTPDDLVTPQPTVLVTGSWLTVKEQMADRYAAGLADRGYTAITFDFTGFGASGGTPRQAEVPTRKIDDMVAVARAATTLSFVRPGALGYLGVCASAQYIPRAIAQGAPIDALVSVAGWFHDAESVAPFYGGAGGVALRLGRAGEALAAFQASGEVRTVPAYEDGNDRAAMFLPLGYYAAADRGVVATWRNEMAELSWLHWLTYDGLTPARQLRTPSLFVHSDDCVLPDNVKDIAERTGAELVWSEGAQIDFYDQDPQVETALGAADRHFRAHLR